MDLPARIRILFNHSEDDDDDDALVDYCWSSYIIVTVVCDHWEWIYVDKKSE